MMVDIPKLEAGRLGGGFLFTLCTLGNCHAWVVGTCYDLHCGQLSRLGSGHLLRSALWAAVKLSSLGGGHLLRSALRAAVTFGWWAPITLCTVRSCHAWVVGICYALRLLSLLKHFASAKLRRSSPGRQGPTVGAHRERARAANYGLHTTAS